MSIDKNLQISVEVTINSPLKVVWEYGMDISKIPDFHPRVNKVDLISGNTKREVGVSYRCNITQGKQKGTCIEKITEINPMKSFTTIIQDDSWGLSKMFENFEVITSFEKINEYSTRIKIEEYYDMKSLKAKLINLLAKKKMKGQTQDTLNSIKSKIEQSIF